MGHFLKSFSSPLSGRCPVAVDDIEQKVRYKVVSTPWLVRDLWVDYPAPYHGLRKVRDGAVTPPAALSFFRKYK